LCSQAYLPLSGPTNPDVAQSTIGSTICVFGWTATIRPSTTYTNGLKKQGIIDYGYTDTSGVARGAGHPDSRQWFWREDVLVSRRSNYPEQFRKDAVELVNSSDRALRQIARELGVNHETLRSWVNVAKQAAEAGPSTEDSAVTDEVTRLQKQVAELRKEKEILRKVAAYFAREMDR
jgi:transposase